MIRSVLGACRRTQKRSRQIVQHTRCYGLNTKSSFPNPPSRKGITRYYAKSQQPAVKSTKEEVKEEAALTPEQSLEKYAEEGSDDTMKMDDMSDIVNAEDPEWEQAMEGDLLSAFLLRKSFFFTSLDEATNSYANFNVFGLSNEQVNDKYLEHAFAFAQFGAAEYCIEVLWQMRNTGYHIKEESIILLTKFFFAEKDSQDDYSPEALFRFINEMITNWGGWIGGTFYSEVVQMAIELKLPVIAVKFYQSYKLAANLEPAGVFDIDDPSLDRQILPVLISIGKFQEADNMFARVDYRNAIIYEHCISLLYFVPEFPNSHPRYYEYCSQLIFEFFEDMITLGLQPRESICLMVLQRASNIGDFQRSIRIFLYICTFSTPTMESITFLFNFVGVDFDAEELLLLFENAQEQGGMKPDRHLYTALVLILLMQNLLESAAQMFLQMTAQQMDPNPVLYLALFRSCVVHNNLRLAKKITIEFSKFAVPLHTTSIEFIKLELQKAGFQVEGIIKNLVVSELDEPESDDIGEMDGEEEEHEEDEKAQQ